MCALPLSYLLTPERNGDYEMAIQCLQEALTGRQEHLDAMDPEIADNLARLGHVYNRQSEYDQAVTVFSDCHSLVILRLTGCDSLF